MIRSLDSNPFSDVSRLVAAAQAGVDVARRNATNPARSASDSRRFEVVASHRAVLDQLRIAATGKRLPNWHRGMALRTIDYLATRTALTAEVLKAFSDLANALAEGADDADDEYQSMNGTQPVRVTTQPDAPTVPYHDVLNDEVTPRAWRGPIAIRAGKVISAANAAHITAAKTAIDALHSQIDAGPDGTLVTPITSGQGGSDGTGSRSKFIRYEIALLDAELEKLDKLHAAPTRGARSATPAKYRVEKNRKGVERLVPVITDRSGAPEIRSLVKAGQPVGQERRVLTGRMEVRAQRVAGSEHLVTLHGTPVVYSTDYTVYDSYGEFTERIHRGALRDVLNQDVRFLINHGGLALARTTNGTLKLTDTPRGLNIEATVDTRSTAANDLVIAIERADISQMSWGFVVASGGDQWNADYTDRTVTRVEELLDVSAVTYPASPTTTIAA